MARETGEFMNSAINKAAANQIGMGEGLGHFIVGNEPRFEDDALSLLARAYAKNIPVTVHVAVGTDIVHVHPEASGTNIGETTYRDFKILCALTRELTGGGVFLNVGSAVIIPEVFLKAVSVVRNLGFALS